MLTLRQQLSKLFQEAIKQSFGADFNHIDPAIQRSQQTNFGDYQANFAMKLASTLKNAPREIAAQVVKHLPTTSIILSTEVSGPSFINICLRKDHVAQTLQEISQDKFLGVNRPSDRLQIVIDYGGANIAKEMHIGHIRSAVIGDSLVRLLEFVGHTVIRQNHLGDWGTQFGMLIQFLVESEWENGKNQDPSELNVLNQSAKKRFDDDKAFAERAKQRVVQLQSGDEHSLHLWNTLVTISRSYFHQLYRRLGLLLQEADDCGESFYNPMLEPLCRHLEEKHIAILSEGALIVPLDGFVDKDNKPLPYLIRKSDGGYLYATTDLAAVQHRIQNLRATRVIYVVDARQKQHFAMLFAAAQKAGIASENTELKHVWFGAILGADKKPFKTRSGESIKLRDVLDEAEERAEKTVENKNPTLPEGQKKYIASTIAIAAVKYADLVNDLTKDYVFDWDKMLAFEGNTAPYLINAYVRIQAIFRKANKAPNEPCASFALNHDNEFSLALELLRFSEVIELVCEDLAPYKLCNYLYDLASVFHSFYEQCPVLKAENQETQESRFALCRLTATVLKTGLSLLGIQVLEQM